MEKEEYRKYIRKLKNANKTLVRKTRFEDVQLVKRMLADRFDKIKKLMATETVSVMRQYMLLYQENLNKK
jgi:hypothetical protein